MENEVREFVANLPAKSAERENALFVLVEELAITIEELRSVENELRRQNADLLIAQDTLERQRKNYIDLFDNAPDGYVVTDRSGMIVEANRMAGELIRIHTDSLVGRFIGFFLGGPEPQSLESILREVRGGRPVTDWEASVRSVEGNVIPVLISITGGSAGPEAGSRLRWAIRDITERRRSEEILKEHAENLKRTNDDLERFAYVASHDLQEPLRTVITFTQLLERRYKGELGPEADDYIRYTVEAGRRMHTLIDNLLEFSRVSRRINVTSHVDPEQILAEALENLRAEAEETGAVVTHDPLPRVAADPSQLVQVFQNLVENAIEYRRERVRPLVHVAAKTLDGMVRFSVQDNGIGIEQQYYERIFIIFQRLHTREHYPGTGIGLALCKRIVERHGGQIWIESEVGKGSTFYFTIPKAAVSRAETNRA